MCGIIGYAGNKDTKEVILEGLEKLEYRGYDSAGLSVIQDGKIKTVKTIGRIKDLKEATKKEDLKSNIGIGHTRWATHGKPSTTNSHPHNNESNTISVVHNGIIENYEEIKDKLIKKGIKFISDTDTEVIPQLISYYYENDLLKATKKALKELRGTYAICVISSEEPDTIIVAKDESPLLIGIGENETFVASDINAIIKYTNKVKYLKDKCIAKITRKEIQIYDQNDKLIDAETKEVAADNLSNDLNGYKHYMIKEINEQPGVIKETLNCFTKNNKILFPNINFKKEDLKDINKIIIIACGTAYHAGLLGKSFIENNINIPVYVEVASEFRYKKNFIDKNTLVVAISQSGETIDTLVSLKTAKEQNATTIAITNVFASTIAREADHVIYTLAGPEIAVASTKAYTSQAITIYLLGLYIGNVLNKINSDKYNKILSGLSLVPNKMKEIIKKEKELDKIVDLFKPLKEIFYFGREVDYYLALEASLKMKEISYIHTEAMPSGELKHGTIALIEKDTPTFFLATNEELYEKTYSNIKEVKSRGAKILILTNDNTNMFDEISDYIVKIPSLNDIVTPLYAIIPMQLLAYKTSIAKGLDVDKPRNLAKSVTVE